MYAHLRIYDVNPGMMSAWKTLFENELIGRMAEAGMGVEARWTSADDSQFIWIRSYGDSEADIAAKEKVFYESPWWVENVDFVRSHLCGRTITVIRPA